MGYKLEALLGCKLEHLLEEGWREAKLARIQAHSLDLLLVWQRLQSST